MKINYFIKFANNQGRSLEQLYISIRLMKVRNIDKLEFREKQLFFLIEELYNYYK